MRGNYVWIGKCQKKLLKVFWYIFALFKSEQSDKK